MLNLCGTQRQRTLTGRKHCWLSYAGFTELRERKRGSFSRGSRAFLHFHEDAGDLYADVRFGDEFERMKVTSPGEQAAFLSRVRATLQHGQRPAIR